MKSLIAGRLTQYELRQSADDPIVEIAPGIAALFPENLDDPVAWSRMYIVAVPRRRHVTFVGVIAPPAPYRAPTIAALRRAARRAA